MRSRIIRHHEIFEKYFVSYCKITQLRVDSNLPVYDNVGISVGLSVGLIDVGIAYGAAVVGESVGLGVAAVGLGVGLSMVGGAATDATSAEDSSLNALFGPGLD